MSLLDRVQKEVFVFVGMFSSSWSNLVLKMSMRVALVEGQLYHDLGLDSFVRNLWLEDYSLAFPCHKIL
jgi:hypothetical protein